MSRENNENKSLFVENIKKLTSSQTYQERRQKLTILRSVGVTSSPILKMSNDIKIILFKISHQ